MKTPALLMLAALLCWGWQTGFLVASLVIGVVLELSRWFSSRWDLEDSDLNRIFDLCTILFVGAAVYLYSQQEQRVTNAFTFAQWQPFIFLPIMLAQAYGNREQMPLRAFSWFLRRAGKNPLGDRNLNVSWLYLAVCLLGASAGNHDARWFYPAIAGLIGLALFPNRPRRLPKTAFVAAFAVVAATGYVGQSKLREWQPLVETMVGNWLGGLLHRGTDPRQSRTAIGEIGQLKLSGRIVMRVYPAKGSPPPGLLRQASYDTYRNGVWWATKSDFNSVIFETNDVIRLLAEKKPCFSATISCYISKQDLLAFPLGTFDMTNLPVVMNTNSLGVAKIEDGPAFVNFGARYGAGQSIDAPPEKADYEVPDRETNVIAQIGRELQFSSHSPTENLRIIGQFFQSNFKYSTYLGSKRPDPKDKLTALGKFLTKTRTGHCEYFASAAVLLLREAGIPARYAVGYGVQESGRRGKTYLVRERHAHAWALAWTDGAWQDFDATPASWDPVEAQRASWFEPISDFFSAMKFQFSKWRWSKESYTKYLVWLLIPLGAFLVWRIVFRKRRKKHSLGEMTKARNWPGLDSEFYLVEQRLSELGFGRAPGEPLGEWHRRLQTTAASPAEDLGSILSLHQRYRFDPSGLQPDERQKLKDQAMRWLDKSKHSVAGN